MTVSSEFIDFLLENLAPLGPVYARRMFGGAGLYCDGLMFALIADDTVYLKADDKTSQDFMSEGLKPFTYHGKSKPITMSYWRVPERLFDDQDEFVAWADVALRVAKSGLKPKRTTAAKKKAKAKSKPKPRDVKKPMPKKKASVKSRSVAKTQRNAKVKR